MTARVGWRERDWAKFNDDEWEALYGYRPGTRPAGPVGSRPAPAADRVRRYVWGAVGIAVVAVCGAALALRPPDAHTAQHTAGTEVVYGIRGTGAAADAPGGSNTVCTEMAIAPSARWDCLAWTINLHHAPVVEAAPYRGPCTHAVVDQRRGAWTCLRG